MIALVAPVFLVLLARAPFGRWLVATGCTRANYAGAPIPTGFGLLLLAASMPAYLWIARLPGSSLWASRLAAGCAAYSVLGWIDDRWGDRSIGGLRGHFSALWKQRRVTTGALKAVLGATVALALAASMRSSGAVDLLAGAALIALAANGFNLVDTRPARAVALSLIAASATSAWMAAAGTPVPAALWVVPAAAAPYLPVERARAGMLGDSGANMLGASAGIAAALALGFGPRAALAALLLGFHYFTERRSLNAFIASHQTLRAVDRWIQGSGDALDAKPLPGRDPK